MAETLGMSAYELMDTMSAAELGEWMAYLSIKNDLMSKAVKGG